MANGISTKEAALASLAASETAGKSLHSIRKHSTNPASNCIVVFSEGDGASNSYWHEADTGCLFDDVLFHGTDHDTDILFVRDPAIEDNWFFGGNLVTEAGITLRAFERGYNGVENAYNTFHSQLAKVKSDYTGKVVF